MGLDGEGAAQIQQLQQLVAHYQQQLAAAGMGGGAAPGYGAPAAAEAGVPWVLEEVVEGPNAYLLERKTGKLFTFGSADGGKWPKPVGTCQAASTMHIAAGAAAAAADHAGGRLID